MPTPSVHTLWTFTSTGDGTVFDARGYGIEHRFYIETAATSTAAYQIRSARTSTGPWAVHSSGTLSSGAAAIVGVTGPVRYLSPRIKTLAASGGAGSTSLIVEVFGV